MAFYALLKHTHTEADIEDLQAYLTDAPSDGSTYGRKNGAWAVVTATGGSTDESLVYFLGGD